MTSASIISLAVLDDNLAVKTAAGVIRIKEPFDIEF